jgi:hypothetical protein
VNHIDTATDSGDGAVRANVLIREALHHIHPASSLPPR